MGKYISAYIPTHKRRFVYMYIYIYVHKQKGAGPPAWCCTTSQENTHVHDGMHMYIHVYIYMQHTDMCIHKQVPTHRDQGPYYHRTHTHMHAHLDMYKHIFVRIDVLTKECYTLIYVDRKSCRHTGTQKELQTHRGAGAARALNTLIPTP